MQFIKPDRVHLLHRAIGEYENYVSRLGHYVSTDGFNFQHATDDPVFAPQEEYEKWGCEDPRITELQGKFYITYVALSKPVKHEGSPPNTAVASTKDFYSFRRYNILTPLRTNDKDSVFFPKKIEGNQRSQPKRDNTTRYHRKMECQRCAKPHCRVGYLDEYYYTDNTWK